MIWQEILGYVASVVVAVSLMMSSIVKLRWINLVGATLFSIYGFIIGALPVGFLNGFIAIINTYYLFKMYDREEYFKIISLAEHSDYQKEFIRFYKDEILTFFPDFKFNAEKLGFRLLVLRDMAIAGIVYGHSENSEELIIDLDFVLKEYRDLKPGQFLYHKNKELFTQQGFKRVIAKATEKYHAQYLLKMGFKKSENELYVLELY